MTADAARRHGWLMVLVALAAAIACAGRGASSDSAAAVSPDSSVRITLERGACFGRCPMYRLELDGAGHVVFDGVNFVKDTGRHEATVPPADVRALVAEMEKAGYFTFDDQYPPRATDHPTVTTSLTIGGRTKRVEHNLGSISAPAGIEDLYARIDDVARSAQWIGERQTGPPLKGRSSEPARKDTAAR